MWAVWALIGTFSLQPPWPQEVVAVWLQEHFLSLGWCWMRVFFPFFFNTVLVRDTTGIEPISY